MRRMVTLLTAATVVALAMALGAEAALADEGGGAHGVRRNG